MRLLREADPNKDAPVATKPHILEEAAKLLELKQLDPVWEKTLGPKLLKIRWEITDDKNCTTRLQARFPDRTSVSAAEVKDAILRVSSAKYPTIGKIVKLEFGYTNEANKKQWKEIASDAERFRLPLTFPGPLLKNTQAFQFRVTFEGRAESRDRAQIKS